MNTMAQLAEEPYVLLTTYRGNGEPRPTPVWIAEVGSELGFTTGADSWKVRRLANDGRCQLQPCDSRGRVKDGSQPVSGHGRRGNDEETERVRSAIADKYGMQVKALRLFGAVRRLLGRGDSSNASVLITLD